MVDLTHKSSHHLLGKFFLLQTRNFIFFYAFTTFTKTFCQVQESKMSAISWSEKNRTIKANASEEKNFIASHRMKLRWFDVYFHLGNITSGGRWKIWIAKSFSFFSSQFSSTSFSQFPFQFALTCKKIVHISLWRSTRICFSAFEINKIHVQPMRHV